MGLLTPFPDSRQTWRNACIGALVMLLGASLPAGARADAFRLAPNSRIALEVDGSFVASKRFSGFQEEDSGVSYVIAELPAAAFDEVKAIGDSQTALAQHGIEDTKKSQLPGREGEYVYVVGQQRSGAALLLKYLLILRQNGVTAMITVNVPEEALNTRRITREQIEHTLTTAKVMPAPTSKGETFQLDYLGPFKEALRGPSKVYNLTGAPPERVTAEPLFVVSTDRSDATNAKVAAQDAFKLIGGFRDHAAEFGKDVVISGLAGYSIIGQAYEIKTENAVGIYFVMLSGKHGNYHVMIGTTPLRDISKYMPEFQKMAASFRVREQQ